MTASPAIRILTVDDHPVVRQGIAGLVGVQPDMTVVAEAANGRDAIQQYRTHRPDVTLMDIQMPEMNGLDALIAFCLLVAARGATSSIDVYLRKRRAVGKPAVIYGAGRGGALLVRELLQNREMGILPVGFIDDDVRKRSLLIEGIPVLGTTEDLGPIVTRHQISELLVAIRDLEAGQLDDLLNRSHNHGLTLRRMRFSVDEVRAVPSVVRHER